MIKHKKEVCHSSEVKCLLGCGTKLKKSDLKDHLRVCDNMCATCNICDQEVFNKEKADHDCI